MVQLKLIGLPTISRNAAYNYKMIGSIFFTTMIIRKYWPVNAIRISRITMIARRNFGSSDARKICLLQPVTSTEIIQKSKFIVSITPATSLPEAMQLLETKGKDPKANHHCWAYRGSTEYDYRCSDDGEPAGTAGKPILTALESVNGYNIMAIVTRYFGGIKLGTGGLMRAYQGVTKRCLEVASQEKLLIEYSPLVKVQVTMPMTIFNRSHGMITKYGNIMMEKESIDSPVTEKVEFSVMIRSEELDSFRDLIRNVSKGQIEVTIL